MVKTISAKWFRRNHLGAMVGTARRGGMVFDFCAVRLPWGLRCRVGRASEHVAFVQSSEFVGLSAEITEQVSAYVDLSRHEYD